MTEPSQSSSERPSAQQGEVWQNVKSGDSWGRGLVMILFVVIVEMLRIVVYALALVQWLNSLLTRKRLEPVVRFGVSLGAYADQIVRYLSYATNDKPFPFGEWPKVAAPPGDVPESETPPPSAAGLPPLGPPLGPLDSGPEPPRG